MTTLVEQSVAPLKPILPLCVCGDPNCCVQYGYCHCGCGHVTVISLVTKTAYGYKRGYPRKFVHGHHNRIRPQLEQAEPFKIDEVYCRLIPLTQGHYAIVDAADYEWLMRWKWFAKKMRHGGYYAYRNIGLGGGRATLVAMHTVISNNSGHAEVDHANRCGLDNRRNNLRPCEIWQNRANRIRNKGKSGFKGVIHRKDKKEKPYEARIGYMGKSHRLGYYARAEDAAHAYDAKARELFGEFAWLNFSTYADAVRQSGERIGSSTQ